MNGVCVSWSVVSCLFGAIALVSAGCVPQNGKPGATTTPSSESAASRSVAGLWDVAYGDALEVEIKLGSARHRRTIGPNGDVVSVTHEGKPVTLDLRCSLENVVCPSEAWPSTFRVLHNNPKNWREFRLAGPDGSNERVGLIKSDEQSFAVLLAAGLGGKGGCALLGLSGAEGRFVFDQAGQATQIADGRVAVGFSGGCVWGDQAAAHGAGGSITVSSSYSAVRR